MRFLYTIGIWFYRLGILLAALFGHEKARKMVCGWKKWRGERKGWQAGGEVAWFHAASLGEFEQARPVLEEYRRRHPESRVVLTFFSPSGYEVRKHYAQADAVLYLPPDLPGEVRRFVDTYRPTIAFFVKYEFWYNYLGELRRRGVPTYYFSVILRPQQYLFRWYGRWFLRELRRSTRHIFVQNEESLSLLRNSGIAHCSIAGDTRFDRVHQIAEAAESDAVVEQFLAGYEGPVVVAGSTWPPDEELISELRIENSELRIILAPHVISEEHLKQIEAFFPDSVRYSQLRARPGGDGKGVLIIDNIGLLSKLYRYATVAYIGGGFGVGIHNILEAVTFGKPVLFGPNYRKFKEACDIIDCGGGYCHHDANELTHNLAALLGDPTARERASQACLDYMNANLGSTELIMNKIEE